MAAVQLSLANNVQVQKSKYQPTGVTFRQKQITTTKESSRLGLTDLSNNNTTEIINGVPGKFKKEIVLVPKKEEKDKKKDEKISRLIHNKTLAEQDLFRAKRIEIELQNKLGIVTVKRHSIEDPMLCGEYAEDIYQYILEQQVLYQVDSNYFQQQTNINTKMRTVLIDWLLQVHYKFELISESLFLTVSITDRYMSKINVEKNKLQLIGITAMLIASKYEDIYPPSISDLIFMTADTYTADDVKALEREILTKLEYKLGETSSLVFLRRLTRLTKVTNEIHTIGKFLVELMLYDNAFLAYLPSVQAAAAFHICLKIFEFETVSWVNQGQKINLEELSGYKSSQLKTCIGRLARRTLKIIAQNEHKAVVNKYSSRRYMLIAKHPYLKGAAMEKLAEEN